MPRATTRSSICCSSIKLAKCQTGIRGLDDITCGGLPQGRATLVCGGAGSGKTLLGVEFLARGARDFGEAGVLVSFEERATDLLMNTASLGLDVEELIDHKRLIIDQVVMDHREMFEAGEYSLDGLFIRLEAAIDKVQARRVVLDTIDILFGSLNDLGIIRSELHRLFEWLKDKGVTSIVTAEKGEGSLTRHGLEEYVSDCVIILDNRVIDQIATRRLRISKYRGSIHGTNEYPFLIDEQGLVILPITNINLEYPASKECLSVGVPKLDTLLGGKGFYRGSTLMVTGDPGTGKSTLAGHFVDAACQRGERSLYFAFEEAPEQILRNMRSVGLDLKKWLKSGSMQFLSARPASLGLELLIAKILKLIDKFQPSVVVLDPISSFQTAGTFVDARSILMRVIDLLKSRGISTMLTGLTQPAGSTWDISTGVASLVDTWIVLRDVEGQRERVRTLSIVKSRGASHSSQVQGFRLTSNGLDLDESYLDSYDRTNAQEGRRGGNKGLRPGFASVAETEIDALARIAELQVECLDQLRRPEKFTRNLEASPDRKDQPRGRAVRKGA